MVEFIEVAGVRRPVSFSLRIAYIYEVKFGRPYLQDVMRLSKALSDVTVKEGEEQFFSLPLALCADIFWAAFKNGYKQSGLVFSEEPDDVTEWFLADSNVLSTLMEMLMKSFPTEEVNSESVVSSDVDNSEKNPPRRNGRR
ncbi:MAG: hypothetical protein ABIK73_07500 [candidate division WOR-3 bacterium]